MTSSQQSPEIPLALIQTQVAILVAPQVNQQKLSHFGPSHPPFMDPSFHLPVPCEKVLSGLCTIDRPRLIIALVIFSVNDLCLETLGEMLWQKKASDYAGNQTGYYSVTFEPPKFGMNINHEVEEIALDSALRYPGMVFVLSKQQPSQSNEGISARALVENICGLDSMLLMCCGCCCDCCCDCCRCCSPCRFWCKIWRCDVLNVVQCVSIVLIDTVVVDSLHVFIDTSVVDSPHQYLS